MAALNKTLREYVRANDVRIAKGFYRKVIAPVYAAAGVRTYDITASFSLGYTWFRIPKNGTHSIMQFLVQAGTPDINSSVVPYFGRRHKRQFRFCFIRNPWDRLVSVYSNKVGMELMFPQCWGKDFMYFIDFVSGQDLMKCDPHLRLQTALFPTADMDYTGRMECFTDDLRNVGQRLGISGEIPHEGKVEHLDYRTFYTTELIERVGDLYRADVDYGNYQF